MTPARALSAHVERLRAELEGVAFQVPYYARLGHRLASRLTGGGRLLAAGNGGSAALAQHLTAELVGRYRGERQPLSAIALHADTSTVTAIVNDYGPDSVFARQVLAHGRPGDVLVAISTSGRSSNLLVAAEAARSVGLEVWAMTGPVPNPLVRVADECLAVTAPDPATVQELQQVIVHLLCEAVDGALDAVPVRAFDGVRHR